MQMHKKLKSEGSILVPLLESRIEPEYDFAKQLLAVDACSDLYSNTMEFGVTRLNNVMSSVTAAKLRAVVLGELEKAKSEAEQTEESSESNRFSKVLSSDNRWDFRLEMCPEVENALHSLLAPGSAVGDLLAQLVLPDGKLLELGAFVTVNGAARQDVHSDTIWSDTPAIYTCLLALQDISPDMGPTIFFPKTQKKEPVYNAASKNRETAEAESASAPFLLGTLACSDAAIYDSRTLHCGGGNSSSTERVVFYFSFTNAAGPLSAQKDFWNVTSIRPEYVDRFSLADFRRPAAATAV
jgi:ectoine hydroxylase-related dioxygenase (phytanoyl-CoA dioxygenase family)